MKKQDYATLAQIFKTDIEALNKQREAQIAIGLDNIKAPIHSEAFDNAYNAVKTLESKIAHIKLIAQSCSMKLHVDRKAFLSACGIYSGSVFD
jgi:hypothetical protein